MKNLVQKIMDANFGRLLKRWAVAVLCVILLGGGTSAALLFPCPRLPAGKVSRLWTLAEQ